MKLLPDGAGTVSLRSGNLWETCAHNEIFAEGCLNSRLQQDRLGLPPWGVGSPGAKPNRGSPPCSFTRNKRSAQVFYITRNLPPCLFNIAPLHRFRFSGGRLPCSRTSVFFDYRRFFKSRLGSSSRGWSRYAADMAKKEFC